MPVTRLIQLFERNQEAISRDCPRGCAMLANRAIGMGSDQMLDALLRPTGQGCRRGAECRA